MRREFKLPKADTTFLEDLGLKWETVREGNVNRLIVREYPVCEGYNHRLVDLYFRLLPTYPDTQIDMVYFHPHLVRIDGKQIKALANEAFDGISWQRWSRHRTPKNPWRPGVDCVETQLALVDHWLRREFKQ